MTSQVNTFTSTGHKLFRHGDLLEQWNCGIPQPQSLQVAPTEHCTLKCKFCSVANREKKYVFDFDRLIEATDEFINLGIQTVEITGGGDPLCYPKLNQYLEHLYSYQLKVGMITNSIGLNKVVDKELLRSLSWLRISANVLDYKDTIELPEKFDGTLGFSYVWTDGISTMEQLERIKKIALDNGVEYIRLVPNCLSTHEEQVKHNTELAEVAKRAGAPVFFQRKNFDTPDGCFWGYLKPFLYCDEYVYPCSSTVLNPDADKQFNPRYRWCHYSEIRRVWEEDGIDSIIDTKNCTHCVFADQNRILEYALQEQEHEEFV